MEFKGTKGEWKAQDVIQKNNYNVELISIDFTSINHVNSIDVYIGENQNLDELKANAKLVASSPDLFEALRQILNAPQPFNEKEFISWVETARIISKKAIEKAIK